MNVSLNVKPCPLTLCTWMDYIFKDNKPTTVRKIRATKIIWQYKFRQHFKLIWQGKIIMSYNFTPTSKEFGFQK